MCRSRGYPGATCWDAHPARPVCCARGRHMSPTKLVVPFLCGCLTPLVIGHAIVDAASQGGAPGPNVRICIDKNDVMRLANGACPNDQRSLLLGSVPSAGGSGKAEDTTPD